MYENVESCTELINGGRNICDCVGEGVIQEKADMCFRACTVSQKGIPSNNPKFWLKSLQEDRQDKYRCSCRVKSTNMVTEWKKIKCIINYIIFYLVCPNTP
jgi:hypothetical protein